MSPEPPTWHNVAVATADTRWELACSLEEGLSAGGMLQVGAWHQAVVCKAVAMPSTTHSHTTDNGSKDGCHSSWPSLVSCLIMVAAGSTLLGPITQA
jgi:hypothetical protein